MTGSLARDLQRFEHQFAGQCPFVTGLVIPALKMFEKPLLTLIFFLRAPGKCIWMSVWKGRYEPNATDSG